MSEATQETLYCIGCGAAIQTTDPAAAGYTPASALRKALANDTQDLYCQRCFRLRHYNEIVPVALSDDDFRHLLATIREANALVVYVVDIFDLNGSIIPGLQRFVGDNPVLLVGNKEDVLPRQLRRTKLREWMNQQVRAQGIKPVGVALTSAKRGHAIDELLALIEKYRRGRDVYVVGVTNVGKSTLINRIIANNTGLQDLITTSRFPGTTLDKIEIPLDDGHKMVDTPGIIHPEQMAHVLSGDDLKLVSPQKEIRPKGYQLRNGQTLFLGGVARLDIVDTIKPAGTVYVDNNLPLHRTRTENADNFYEKHVGELITPPTGDAVKDFPPLVRHEFKTTGVTDVVFEGLGWVTVPGDTRVAGWAPRGVDVVTRPAMINKQ
ncbi:ribosome biogenesis GTPase YqeH [Lactiplantibacillus modestisalitolerans]|uniref:Ribosome biogenesis GTPase YqeH n=1 Tax=Lactiplantibacillus modestisalitolerans TaxID=1457219 RepID=A0ABV5WXU9_9LACO|nr:ribosome biogenesis GTPase YqeH [Lactiplantibacillus modestisalitolerans]